ncbi:Leucine carboxyl methyltransferase 1 [Nowakowskiella sp. JEL0407]|nr:Leucine carboxyl methyltransferase 1 [Nowakowskiella sp. JEL0407]
MDFANESHEENVISTDTSALQAKVSAVSAGYLSDPFAVYFHKGRKIKQTPIFHRGTYTRTKSIGLLMQMFIENFSERCQIISLGAGSDTRYFNLLATQPELLSNVHYYELDFHLSTIRKSLLIQKHKILPFEYTTSSSSTQASIHSSTYSLIPFDLRNFSSFEFLEQYGFDPKVPTMVLGECLFCYLSKDVGDLIIQKAQECDNVFVVSFDMLGEDDFAKVMVRNLKAKNIELPSLSHYTSVSSHVNRYISRGFNASSGLTMLEIYKSSNLISPEERSRIEKLEVVDELEEWELLAGHYGLVWALNGDKMGTMEEALKRFTNPTI